LQQGAPWCHSAGNLAEGNGQVCAFLELWQQIQILYSIYQDGIGAAAGKCCRPFKYFVFPGRICSRNNKKFSACFYHLL
jgi:hypothetical protein